jgi:hypothetical protein
LDFSHALKLPHPRESHDPFDCIQALVDTVAALEHTLGSLASHYFDTGDFNEPVMPLGLKVNLNIWFGSRRPRMGMELVDRSRCVVKAMRGYLSTAPATEWINEGKKNFMVRTMLYAIFGDVSLTERLTRLMDWKEMQARLGTESEFIRTGVEASLGKRAIIAYLTGTLLNPILNPQVRDRRVHRHEWLAIDTNHSNSTPHRVNSCQS